MKFNIATTLVALTLLANTLSAQIPIGSSTTIDQPGSYRLSTGLLVSNDAAINITASDVTLDLNGQTISGAANLSGVGIRIRNAQNVTVRNGNIQGVFMGVVALNSSNIRIERLMIRAYGLAVSAPPPEVGIMLMQTRNAVVIDNQIYNAGLGIFVRGSNSFGNRIEGNTITAGPNGALGICYNPADGDLNGPTGDIVTRNLIRGYPTAVSIGGTSNFNVVTGNMLFFRTAASSNPNASNSIQGNTEVQLK